MIVNYQELRRLLIEALLTDGGHHKQWYLQQLASMLGVDISDVDFEEGIAP